MKRIVIALFALFLPTSVTWAVQNGSGYQTTQPTNAQVPNWTTGWGESGITGWNYIGQVNGASGIYLGNGWVLTAGHVGMGDFVLNGNTYPAVADSAQTISNAGGTADLCLFQISTTSSNNGTVLNLPALPLRASDPVAFAYGVTGSAVVMIGYGGGQGESWGFNTVTEINYFPVQINSFNSNDFITDNGVVTVNNPHGPGSQSITNNAQLVLYDSGGGDFIYNTNTGQWELAGLNEVVFTDEEDQVVASGFVQLDTYAPQINAYVNPPSASETPTMPLPWLGAMGSLLFLAASRFLSLTPLEKREKG